MVENRTAAAGTVAALTVAKAPADGYTLGLVLSGQLVINPFVQKQMPFDVLKELLPVAALGEAPQMIAINAEVPAKTLKELVALAKAKPGSLNYGSAGHGSLPHLSAAEFVRQAGIEMVHVPYKGNAPATADLLAGRIQLLSSSIGGLRAGARCRQDAAAAGRHQGAAALHPGRADLGRGRHSRLPDDGVARAGRAAPARHSRSSTACTGWCRACSRTRRW